jgi:ketosteroid isomerase-like protein
MKLIFSLLTCVLVGLIVIRAEDKTGTATKSGNGVEDVILKIEHQWAEAWVKRDIDSMKRFVAPDWTAATEDGELTNKVQFDADLKNGVLTFESLKIDDMKVRIYGDTVIVSGVETEKSKYKDKDTSGTYRFTDVFVRRDGQWRAIASHISRVASQHP